MGKNVRENFGVLAAIAELAALAQDNPLMRQVMFRLSAAYRELDQHGYAGASAQGSATVVEIGRRAAPCRWHHTAKTVGRVS